MCMPGWHVPAPHERGVHLLSLSLTSVGSNVPCTAFRYDLPVKVLVISPMLFIMSHYKENISA